MNRNKRNSLSHKFGIRTVAAVLLTSILLSVLFAFYNAQRYRDKLTQRLNEVSQVIRAGFSNALWNLNRDEIRDFVNALFTSEDFAYLRLYDDSGLLFEKTKDEYGGKRFEFFKGASGFMTYVGNIEHSGSEIGEFQVVISNNAFHRELWVNIAASGILVLAIMSVIYFIARKVGTKHIFTPLKMLEEAAETIARGELENPIKYQEDDEIGHLTGSLETMRESLKESTENLENQVKERTEQLEEAKEKAEIAKEKAEKANQAKDLFMASVSHELMTPMNNILGFTNFLKKTNLSTKQNDYLKEVAEEADDLKWLIRDIIDFTKMKTTGFVINNEPFPIKQACQAIINKIKQQEKKKNEQITFTCFIDDKIPEVVEGDRRRLKQILYNFLSNAFKYTESGKIILHINLIENKNDSARIKFSVKDTGCGIAPEDMDKVFEPFERIIDPAKKTISGIGLGLSITKHLIKLMEGSTKAESKKGVGSEFSAIIPFHRVSEGKPLDDHMEPDYSHTVDDTLSGARVLVVEDNPSSQKLMQAMLESAGLAVDIAGDGETAIKRVQSGNYDVVLMDMQIPVKDGFQATEEIRTMDKFTKLPIIAVSASAPDEQFRQFLQEHLTDAVPKPVEFEKLIAKIVKCLPEDKKSQVKSMGETHKISILEIKEKDLLEKAGIDVEDALKRTKVTYDNFRESLYSFVQNHEKSINLLRRHLKNSDWTKAKDLCHKLKGAALGISATHVAELTESIENHIKWKMIDIDNDIQDLDSMIIQCCNAVKETKTGERSSTTDLSPEKKIDFHHVYGSLGEMESLLKEKNTMYLDIFGHIKKDLKSLTSPSLVKQLEDAVNNIECETALNILEQIKKSLT